jgi:hypothetical protein
MAASSNELFYSRLPVNEIPLSDLLMEDHLFYKAPDNWHVVITDIKSSSTAVDKGRHTNVNLVATGSMVAVLNISQKAGITVPAFFGGDGATFIIPPALLPSIINALDLHRENSRKNFNLTLRVGHLPVADISAHGHNITVCKLRTSKIFVIPIVLGDGLAYAESIIKSPGYSAPALSMTNEELDLSGMQCRWDMIEPPQNDDEVVSLLVQSFDPSNQAPVFKKVIDILDEIYGEEEKRKPITVSRLRLKRTLQKLVLEMRTKFKRYAPFYLAKSWVTSLIAPLYFKTKTGKTYLDQLVAMSDTLIIDGRINTVISGSAEQRKELVTALDQLEKNKDILYGFHISKASVLSCYVRSMNEGHIHFVDGAEGGYTNAALMLKKKTASLV